MCNPYQRGFPMPSPQWRDKHIQCKSHVLKKVPWRTLVEECEWKIKSLPFSYLIWAGAGMLSYFYSFIFFFFFLDWFILEFFFLLKIILLRVCKIKTREKKYLKLSVILSWKLVFSIHLSGKRDMLIIFCCC